MGIASSVALSSPLRGRPHYTGRPESVRPGQRGPPERRDGRWRRAQPPGASDRTPRPPRERAMPAPPARDATMGRLDGPRPTEGSDMALIRTLLDYVLHLDKHLHMIIQDY